MQATMDKLRAADWYYKTNGERGGMILATPTGVRHIGHEGVGIVEGGYVYATMSSSTLAALEKRGLVEIIRDGGRMIDAVKVVGLELPERLTKAVAVKVTRTYSGAYSHWSPWKTIAYVLSEADVPRLVEHYSTNNDTTVTAEILGEVDLEVWDMLR
jgi:hypothetical protein